MRCAKIRIKNKSSPQTLSKGEGAGTGLKYITLSSFKTLKGLIYKKGEICFKTNFPF
jgi:hypothetical protein